MSFAYYNENNREAAAWLRELIRDGLIAPGDVDERSILDVRPHELTRYTQQHFFAGIGGWSLALRLAGWPDSRPVRTGSCPCQPFSVAGQGLAEKDERHLWPVFRDLITFGEPTITLGEQVASKAGRKWLTGVRADLEALGYEVGAADLCAAGTGAPHIRQRLYWMAHTDGRNSRAERKQRGRKQRLLAEGSGVGGVADSEGKRRERRQDPAGTTGWPQPEDSGAARGLEHATGDGRQQRRSESGGRGAECGCGACGMGHAEGVGRPRWENNEDGGWRQLAPGHSGAWSNFDILPCRDGKARRIKSGLEPLVTGLPRGVVPGCDPCAAYAEATAEARRARLHGYGNSIVPQMAAEFILAAMEAIP